MFTVFPAPEATVEELSSIDDSSFRSLLANLPEVDHSKTYCIMQLERAPDTGRLHFQGYLHLPSARTFASVKRYFIDQTVHIEAAAGRPGQCITYCSKEDTRVAGPWKYNVELQPDPGKRTDIESLIAEVQTKKGRLDYTEPLAASYLLRHGQRLNDLIKELVPACRPSSTPLLVLALWGTTGTGKTRFVHDVMAKLEKSKELYVFPVVGNDRRLWADGYRNHQAALLDDFSTSFLECASFLRVTDRYVLDLPTKGGFTRFSPRVLFITSNFNPAYWYEENTEQRAAVQRRLTHVFEVKEGWPTDAAINAVASAMADE